jgi:phage shock protein A
MFRAIGRLFKSVIYFITGKTDAAADKLGQNANVVKASYDEIIRDKKNRIQEYQKAVAGLIAHQEKKMATVRALTKETEKLEQLKAGALAKAKHTVSDLQEAGAEKDEIHNDPEYKKCLGAYNDFGSTLDEKQARIEELEEDIAEDGTRVGEHKVMLEELAREIKELASEKHEAVADVISAQEEKNIADAISGISDDSTTEELQRLRDARQQMKAEARVSREMAGTDSKKQEADFLEYARTSQDTSEFDSLIGLAEEKDAVSASPSSSEKLPE